jgi:hypothetical protein
MLGDLVCAQWATALDQGTQEALSMRKLSDPVCRSRLDTRIDEARQKSIVTQNANSRVARPHYLAGYISDPLENCIDIELRGECQPRLD